MDVITWLDLSSERVKGNFGFISSVLSAILNNRFKLYLLVTVNSM